MGAFDDILGTLAAKHGLDPELLRAQILQESSGNPRATSPAGAMGLGQLMPDTAKELGVQDPYDPHQNVAGMAQYLDRLDNQFPGDMDAVLAAYHSGAGNVRKAGWGKDPNWLQNLGPRGREYPGAVRARIGQPLPDIFGAQGVEPSFATNQPAPAPAALPPPLPGAASLLAPGLRGGSMAPPTAPARPVSRPGDGAFGSGIANSFDQSVEQATPWLQPKPAQAPLPQPQQGTPVSLESMLSELGMDRPMPQPDVAGMERELSAGGPFGIDLNSQMPQQPPHEFMGRQGQPVQRAGGPDPRGSLVERGDTQPEDPTVSRGPFPYLSFLSRWTEEMPGLRDLPPDHDVGEYEQHLLRQQNGQSRFGSKPEPETFARDPRVGDVYSSLLNPDSRFGAKPEPDLNEPMPQQPPHEFLGRPEEIHHGIDRPGGEESPAAIALKYHLRSNNPEGLFMDDQRQQARGELGRLMNQQAPPTEPGGMDVAMRLARAFAAGGAVTGNKPFVGAEQALAGGEQERLQRSREPYEQGRERMGDLSKLLMQDQSTRQSNFSMQQPDMVELPDGRMIPATAVDDLLRAENMMDPNARSVDQDLKRAQAEALRAGIGQADRKLDIAQIRADAYSNFKMLGGAKNGQVTTDDISALAKQMVYFSGPHKRQDPSLSWDEAMQMAREKLMLESVMLNASGGAPGAAPRQTQSMDPNGAISGGMRHGQKPPSVARG